MLVCRPCLGRQWKQLGFDEPVLNFEELLRTETITGPQLQGMIGMGIHLPLVGSFVMYLLSVVELVQEDAVGHPRSIADVHDVSSDGSGEDDYFATTGGWAW